MRLADLGDVSKSQIRTPGGGSYYRPITRLVPGTGVREARISPTTGLREERIRPSSGQYESAGISRQVRNTVTRSRQTRQAGNQQRPTGERGAEAKQQYLADRAAVKAERKAQYEAGQTRRGTQAQAQEELARKRRYAQSEATRTENRRNRTARRKEEAYVKNAEKEYNKIGMLPSQRHTIIGGTAIAAPSAAGAIYLGQKDRIDEQPKKVKQLVGKMDEETKRNIATAAGAGLGGVAGAAGATAGLTYGGNKAKRVLARRRKDFLINNPDKRAEQERAWKQHTRSYGYNSILDAPDEVRTKMKRTTPKNIHDWRADRALAWKNTKGVVPAVTAATAMGGAGLAANAVRNRYKRTSDAAG